MLIDLFKKRAPVLRLCLGLWLGISMQFEISARSGSVLLAHEQLPPTSLSEINAYLGATTTQSFILTVDRLVFTIMTGSFVSTVTTQRLEPVAAASPVP